MRTTLIGFIWFFIGLTATQAQQRSFTFQVNDENYTVSQQRMNEFFGATFQQLISKGVCEQGDFYVWKDSYERFLDNAERGRYLFTTYGRVYGGFSFKGDMTEYDRGYDDKGRKANGNPNKKDHKAERMQVLNYYLPRLIINNETPNKVDW